MSSSNGSTSVSFFSDDEDAYRRDYQLEREYQVDDLARGGLKIDATESSRKADDDVKQPEIIRQTNQSFLRSSKFVGLDRSIHDNVAQSLEESLKGILTQIDSGSSKGRPGSRLNRFSKRNSSVDNNNNESDHILKSVQQTATYAATQLKPVVIQRTQKQANNTLPPSNNALFTTPQRDVTQDVQPNTINSATMQHIPEQPSKGNTLERLEIQYQGIEAYDGITSTQQTTETQQIIPLDFEFEEEVASAQACQLTEAQFKTFTNSDPYSLSTEDAPHPLATKVIMNNKLTLFCYNIESMPHADDVVLLWGKVLTEVEDGKKFIQTNPYVNRAQAACVVIRDLQRVFYVLPKMPIELLDTARMPPDEINELFDRVFEATTDAVSDNDADCICHDRDMLPSDTERNQADIINISAYEHLKASILNILQTKYNINSKTVSVRPVWRRYVFNQRSLPRNPRIWIEVKYPANKAIINPRDFGKGVICVRKDTGDFYDVTSDASDIGVAAIVGHTVAPLEIWLAKMRISGPMWLVIPGIDWNLYNTRTQVIAGILKQNPRLSLAQAAALYSDSRSCTLLFHEFHATLSHTPNSPTIEPLYKLLNMKSPNQLPLPLLSVCTVNIRYIPEQIKVQPQNGSKTPQSSVRNGAVVAVVNYHPGYSIEGSTFHTEILTQTHILAKKHTPINLPSESAHVIPLDKMSYDTLSHDASKDSLTISIHIKLVDKEIQLYEELSRVIMMFNPDILIGHNIYSHLYTALWRTRSCLTMDSFKNIMLVGFSRLHPRILHIESMFRVFQAIRSTWHVMSVLHGRLIVDLEKGITEFAPDTKLTAVDYIASTLLKKELVITPPSCFSAKFKSGTIFKTQLIPELVSEILALIGIANTLNLLPLTCRISQLTALPWQLVCSAGRARRAESLILYSFYVLPYIIPDLEHRYSDQKQTGTGGTDKQRNNADTGVDAEIEEDINTSGVGYEGGYVMDPVTGLHDTIVIVLDFNSLYPSIIREYSLCFTTLDPANYAPNTSMGTGIGSKETLDGVNNAIEEEVALARQVKYTVILPRIIARLINQRLAIKAKIKDVEAMQGKDSVTTNQLLKILDISQLAVKLCANAMYGSLGYQYGRFYCPHVAARIPAKGRMELVRASTIANQQGYKVIYGDTDSIMVKTNLEYNASEGKKILPQIRAIASSISEKVAEGRTYLQLGLDYIFVKYLLLQKKKYAAVHLLSNMTTTLEYKGLDLVRRDWCPISRTVSKKALDIIMAEPPNTVVNKLLSMLTACYAAMISNRTPSQELLYVQQFKMTKSLTKHLHQYSTTAVGQLPHVFVASELQRVGKIVRMGDIIEYIILSPAGLEVLRTTMNSANRQSVNTGATESSVSRSSDTGSDITKRAIPFEFYVQYLTPYPSIKLLDMNWYIRNQILPPLQRVCSHVPGLFVGQLAECFGIDAQKYISDVAEENTATFNRQEYSIDIRHRFSNCCCFIYHCTCNSPKSVTAWPPPVKSYQSSEDMAVTPYPNLDVPSDAFRKEGALKGDEPLLHPLDFDTLRCGCHLRLGVLLASLNKQLSQICRLYEEQLSYCTHQTCPLYMKEDMRRKVYPGCYTNQLEVYNVQHKKYVLASLSGKECRVPGCGGTIIPVFTPSVLCNQLLFFSLLFNLTSPLYTVPDKRTYFNDPEDRIRTIFTEAKKLIDSYIARNSYLQIDMSDRIEALFTDLMDEA